MLARGTVAVGNFYINKLTGSEDYVLREIEINIDGRRRPGYLYSTGYGPRIAETCYQFRSTHSEVTDAQTS